MKNENFSTEPLDFSPKMLDFPRLDSISQTIPPKPAKPKKKDKPVHKPSKYHYHLKVDPIYGDKILKLCGQCRLPSNLTNDLRFLEKNMKRSRSSESIATTSITDIDIVPSYTKLNTKDFFDLHHNSTQSIDGRIEFNVLDLTAERESGLNLRIVVLPPDLFQFKQLKRLHLDCNQIRVIPEALGENLMNLEILTLTNNKLTVNLHFLNIVFHNFWVIKPWKKRNYKVTTSQYLFCKILHFPCRIYKIYKVDINDDSLQNVQDVINFVFL